MDDDPKYIKISTGVDWVGIAGLLVFLILCSPSAATPISTTPRSTT